MAAVRSNWKIEPFPAARKLIPFERSYSLDEFSKIREGLIPQAMEDKWFIFFESPWLHFHRSWTGFCVYQLRLDVTEIGVHAVEAWVNRDSTQYNETDDASDVLLLAALLDSCADRQDSKAWDQFVSHKGWRSKKDAQPPLEMGDSWQSSGPHQTPHGTATRLVPPLSEDLGKTTKKSKPWWKFW